ncbi:VCBS repeat-containing protein [Solirubrobacter phytolaccae]|uniref:VCBS repeat-containing protein n=1 Tax=Solirubrobacter phytolaccae TaxID=1404360 RepID=A0A9X3N5E1_9ACTN|nr:VCBS repeat-containing protein [Solirubrobacter phytolaccae]MDA0180220.1 VCBS repeat-containing protein [Solirubrobacter phytolaccae]
MKKPFRWIGAALAVLVVAAPPAHAAFLQEIGSPFAVGSIPWGMVSSDFNRDGRPDIVAINGGAGTASLLVRQPTGGFTTEGVTTVAAASNWGTVADFNRDGWPDFAVSGWDPGTASVSLRNPAGGFLPAPATPVATGQLGAIASADFNGDGLVDLAVGQYSGNTVTILQQRVDGTFSQEGPALATGLGPRYLASADFNADGRPDLAVTNTVGGTVTVLLGKAGGGFQEEAGSPITVGASPWFVVAGDLNGDGRTDLAVANNGSDTVSLLERGAAGGFTASTTPVAGAPMGLATADFNRDGLLDLAVTSHNANTVSVLLRQPGGTYTLDSGSPLATGSNPATVVAPDFNLDGKPDLAISNRTADSVTVLLNTTPDPTTPPPPPPPPPTPSINARLVLAWTVSKTSVKINSARLRDVPVGARVRIFCKTCKVSQTLTAKAKTVTISKLRDKRLKRKATFTVTITAPGHNGLTFTRKVKNYGRTKKALRKAVKAPFVETRRCVALAAGTKC